MMADKRQVSNHCRYQNKRTAWCTRQMTGCKMQLDAMDEGLSLAHAEFWVSSFATFYSMIEENESWGDI